MYLSQINKISWGVTRQKQALLLTFLRLSDFQSIQTKDTKELIYIYNEMISKLFEMWNQINKVSKNYTWSMGTFLQ